MNRRSINQLFLIAVIAGALATFAGQAFRGASTGGTTADGRICTACGPMPR